MCIEDIRLGRKTRSHTVSKVIGTTSTEVVARAADRSSLVLSSHPTARITYSTETVAVDGVGVVIPPATGPVLLDIQHHGDLVIGPLSAISSAATTTVSFVEVFQPEK